MNKIIDLYVTSSLTAFEVSLLLSIATNANTAEPEESRTPAGARALERFIDLGLVSEHAHLTAAGWDVIEDILNVDVENRRPYDAVLEDWRVRSALSLHGKILIEGTVADSRIEDKHPDGAYRTISVFDTKPGFAIAGGALIASRNHVYKLGKVGTGAPNNA